MNSNSFFACNLPADHSLQSYLSQIYTNSTIFGRLDSGQFWNGKQLIHTLSGGSAFIPMFFQEIPLIDQSEYTAVPWKTTSVPIQPQKFGMVLPKTVA